MHRARRWKERSRKISELGLWLRTQSPCIGSIDMFILVDLPSLHPSLEKAMAPHSSTLAWKIPWTEEPGRLQSMLRVGHDWVTSLSLFTFMPWRRNGNPLQCSCLENPRDGGAWWAAVYGVSQSRTRLKWLSSILVLVGNGEEDQYFLEFCSSGILL